MLETLFKKLIQFKKIGTNRCFFLFRCSLRKFEKKINSHTAKMYFEREQNFLETKDAKETS